MPGGFFVCLQLGGKGYGDPLAFDNTYYTTLLQKPWADKSNTMNQHIGEPSILRS